MYGQRFIKDTNIETKSKTKKKFHRLGVVGLIVFSVIIIVSATILIQSLGEYMQGDASYTELRNNVTEVIGNPDKQSSTQTSGEPSTGLSAESFGALSKQNSDFRAWIFQEGTNIDYPVVIGKDNEYYLTHLFNGEENKLGCLFMDYRNASDFSDKNTVIYGHNMKNGSMFHSIADYADPNVYAARPTMTIYTGNKTYTLELFAGNIVSGDSQLVEFNFENDNNFMDYVNNLKANSTFKSDVDVKPGDRLVTLFTCTYEFNNARYELVGKLIEES